MFIQKALKRNLLLFLIISIFLFSGCSPKGESHVNMSLTEDDLNLLKEQKAVPEEIFDHFENVGLAWQNEDFQVSIEKGFWRDETLIFVGTSKYIGKDERMQDEGAGYSIEYKFYSDNNEELKSSYLSNGAKDENGVWKFVLKVELPELLEKDIPAKLSMEIPNVSAGATDMQDESKSWNEIYTFEDGKKELALKNQSDAFPRRKAEINKLLGKTPNGKDVVLEKIFIDSLFPKLVVKTSPENEDYNFTVVLLDENEVVAKFIKMQGKYSDNIYVLSPLDDNNIEKLNSQEIFQVKLFGAPMANYSNNQQEELGSTEILLN